MKDNKNGLHFLFKYRRLWLIAIILGSAFGAGISFFISPKYRSTAIVYPYNSQAREDLVANPQFGFEFESEQLMQLLGSKYMRDRTIEKFKLYDYYKIDTTKKSWNSNLTLKYVKDVTFLRSKFLSVVINVTMKDPVLAANIANFQVDEVDKYRASIFKENRQADLEKSKLEMESIQTEVDSLKKAIYAQKGGTDKLLFNFLENLNNENYDPSEFVDSPELEKLVIDYRFAYDHYVTARNDFETKREAIQNPIPSVYELDRAQPSYMAISPSFSANIAMGALTFFILVFLLRYTMDKWKRLKQEMTS